MENPPKRGAPYGNTNALKTGFYARKLPASDIEELESYRFEGLTDEISLLRLLIRRVYEDSLETDNPRYTAAYLRLFSQSLTTLARLLRIDLIVHPDTTLADEIEKALAGVVAEMEKEKQDEQSARPSMTSPYPAGAPGTGSRGV